MTIYTKFLTPSKQEHQIGQLYPKTVAITLWIELMPAPTKSLLLLAVSTAFLSNTNAASPRFCRRLPSRLNLSAVLCNVVCVIHPLVIVGKISLRGG